MLRLEANQVERRIGDRLLFRIAGVLRLYEGERVGLVGVNGAGKSTLLSVLAGLEEPDGGTVARHGSVAVVRQLDEAGERAGTGPSEESLAGGETEAPEGEPSRPAEYATMSGGERTRWKWRQAMRKRAALLFADEPTSHLDTEGAAEVEEELRTYEGTVLLISHDRMLLDRVCTRILELEDGEVREYSGNFSEYRRQKELRRERALFEYEQYDKERKRLERAAVEKAESAKGMKREKTGKTNTEARLGKDQFNRRKSKVEKTAQAIRKRIEQLEVKEKPKSQEQPVFDIRYHKPIHAKEAIRLERVTRSFGARMLFRPFSCGITPGMRLGIVGPNGSGKTTLLQTIVRGEAGVWTSAASQIGYFDQRLEGLDEERTVLGQVAESSDYPETSIRTALARLLMKRDDVFKPVSVLSGGEKVKAALAKLFMADCNVLLLDEPTNYLDIFARAKLAEVLREYPGTILFCSHDRFFLDEVATHLLVIENGEWTFEIGGYSEYRERKKKRHCLEMPPEGDAEAEKEKLAELVPAVEYRERLTPAEREAETMRLELELTGLLGRLAAPGKHESKPELEAAYNECLGRLKQLKQR
ncbi:ribosomal protection-like ABC-F family protein [Paenibacillus ginsengarvi]|uniref:ABC-F type ribosomal protection protein n=1 Tax=Paenibacillus ginsengarvi TaxID=400777 RepID=A0A3B0C138_9BACL|nr:ABC-F type ribosomal protection protein [Paenibacillus ginsengarvi]RKN78184.1 ABC-F type ribosomal protection protein [Paenibacillus ginsengarvi]